MMTLDFESFIRSVNACELNPEKTTICIAPILLHANIATGNSGTMGRYIVTRSPFFTPKLRRAFANLFTSTYNWLYVRVRTSPDSFSHIIAALFFVILLMCLSRQFTEAFIKPPVNHFAKGGFQSRVLSHLLLHVKLSACRS